MGCQEEGPGGGQVTGTQQVETPTALVLYQAPLAPQHPPPPPPHLLENLLQRGHRLLLAGSRLERERGIRWGTDPQKRHRSLPTTPERTRRHPQSGLSSPPAPRFSLGAALDGRLPLPAAAGAHGRRRERERGRRREKEERGERGRIHRGKWPHTYLSLLGLLVPLGRKGQG